ncbi:TetR/AcrR family transcriptional regulator [Saccharopolyspora mangrovi]|uniref:TetR family transcriptional regulator n=1 Tax=Saccharopolyspora mangrovi TaxID=3082379 RepID=A0ABU6ACF3_9PSEU|nr:TetR family transcriptional regulator [Saccharopolyspora sp. S2-29]MEB3369151.1 TetR family transcriptional regulator [Saccharopolyspora sp. S2-29]
MPTTGSSIEEQRRDACATRESILRAARRRFSSCGYADVTLRDIAADADVSAALVVKYFGGKEDLFAQASDFQHDAEKLLDCELPELGEHLVRTLLDYHDRTQGDPLVRAVFTSSRPAGARFRDNFESQLVTRLAERLSGPRARLRAELVCSHLMGLGAARLVLRTQAITAEPTEELVAITAPLIQNWIDNPL